MECHLRVPPACGRSTRPADARRRATRARPARATASTCSVQPPARRRRDTMKHHDCAHGGDRRPAWRRARAAEPAGLRARTGSPPSAESSCGYQVRVWPRPREHHVDRRSVDPIAHASGASITSPAARSQLRQTALRDYLTANAAPAAERRRLADAAADVVRATSDTSTRSAASPAPPRSHGAVVNFAREVWFHRHRGLHRAGAFGLARRAGHGSSGCSPSR